MAEKQIFETLLEKHETMDAAGITIPFDVEKVFGAKRVPVRVLINGAEYRSTIMRMGGKYVMAVPKTFRERAGIKAGEMITVEMEKDSEKRRVEVPDDLAGEIKKHDLQNVWDKLSFSHQKEFALAIEDAKKEETRKRRIEKTIEQLISRRK